MTDSELQDDVIKTDEDTAEEDSGDGGLYPYDPTQADIDIREEPQTIFDLLRKSDKNQLIIDPDFQRTVVW